MNYLPTFLDVKDASCLVVGGGEAAAKKTELLLRAKARVTVLAPTIDAQLQDLVRDGRVLHRADAFVPEHVAGHRLVIAAVEDDALASTVAGAARDAGVPVNVVDRPALCSFIVPSLVDREPVLVAISTGGTAPVLGRDLRARIEGMLPANYGRIAAFASGFRARVKRCVREPARRRRLWENVLEGRIAEHVLAGREPEAAALMQREIEASHDCDSGGGTPGEVCIVEVPPGAEDLLSLLAIRTMQRADLVVHDGAMSIAALDLVRRDAIRSREDDVASTRSLAACCAAANACQRVVVIAPQGQAIAALARGLHRRAGGSFAVRILRCAACECIAQHVGEPRHVLPLRAVGERRTTIGRQ